MTTIYAAAIGHDVPDNELIAFDPQPSCEGIVPTVRNHAASGKPNDQGKYVAFVFPVFDGEDDYRSMLALCGLDGSEDAVEVTVRTRDHKYNDVRVNGLAIFPEHGTDTRYNYFPRTTIIVRDLELLA